MLPENEYSEIESRYYLNPQIALDESNNFIENLRSTQQQNTAQITRDTEQLGTAVSSSLGGLGGSTDYWTARYSTPQTAQLIQDLRTTAQAQALNEVLQNEQAIWKQRYQNAYRNYQRRAASGGGGGGPQTPSTTAGQGETEEKSTSKKVGSVEPSFSPLDFSGNYTYDYYTKGFTGEVSKKPLTTGIIVTKDKSGNVTSMVINGKTWTGEEAANRFADLDRRGELRGRKNEE